MSRAHWGGNWTRLRREILDRDGWRCRKCGRAGRLEVHHLDHNSANRDPANLTTRCRDCHRDEHRRDPTPAEAEWARHLDGF